LAAREPRILCPRSRRPHRGRAFFRRPDGTRTTYAYLYCSGVNGGTASCPVNGAYLVESFPLAPDGVTQAGPDGIAYYDALGRAIASDTQAFDASQWIRSETLYDSFGRVSATSRPFFLTGGTPALSVNSYLDPNGNNDPLGRAWSVTAPDASVTTTTYDALTTKVTNARGAVTTTLKNAQGLIASVTDAVGQATSYAYDSFGDMSTANPPGPAITHNTYDLRGRKLTASDPDMGLWSYSYDAFGELASQTDALGHVTAMAYDALGRLVSRVEPDMSASWTYGTSAASHNIDKLIAASCGAGASGNVCASGGYGRAYLYDTYGRPSKLTITIGSSSYYTTTAYDLTTGQKSAVRAFSGFSLDYLYTTRGYLSSIVDAVTAQPYWAANARDAELHTTQTTFGNGVVTNEGYDPLTGRVLSISAGANQSIANFSYQWDQVGNLLTRTDMLAISGGETEVSCYDLLNRLTNADLSNGASCTGSGATTMTYNTDGGIRSKTGVGTYAYGAGAGPHALTSITGTVNGVVNPTFSYDANGNMMSGAGRTVTYTASNMISSMSEGTTNLTLTYDPEHARIQQAATVAGTTITTTYLNDPTADVMTESTHKTGVNTWKTYIVADGKIVGQRVTTSGQTNPDMKYFVLDHLGSVAVITDGNQYLADGVTPNPAYGTAVQRSFYDAWGKERNADGSADATCSLPAQSQTTRGYTNQEEMPSVCLVNYNARIYDPAIGKFMTPDDIIPDAYNGQSYNRYTYVEDNPLSYEDPTGHLNCTGCTGLSNLTGDNPDSDCYGMCAVGPGNLAEAIANTRDTISHTNPGLTPTGKSTSGLTNDTTYQLPQGNEVYVPGGQTPDANHQVRGLLSVDMNSELGKAIEAGNADMGSFKFDPGSERLSFNGSDGSVETVIMDEGRYDHIVTALGFSLHYNLDQASIDKLNQTLAADPAGAIEFQSIAHSLLWTDESCQCEEPSMGLVRVYVLGDKLTVDVVGGTAMPAPHTGVQDLPKPDPNKGTLLFEFHPHPSGDTHPSPDDLSQSYHDNAPGLIYPAGKSPVWYQAFCVRSSC
jgi:RHS repeat-associated protein